MEITHAVLAFVMVLGSAASFADSRNPFDPAGVKSVAPSPVARMAPVPPFVLPPPQAVMPPRVPAPPPQVGTDLSVESKPDSKAGGKTDSKASSARPRPKDSPMRVTAGSCQIKVKTESVAAPAYGGIVPITLLGGAKDCVSAVLVEKDWLEAKELSDPTTIKLAVDANDTSSPRQSNIVIANAVQSVTVTLVQEGRATRNR